jgi:hypothetical protein
MSGCPTLKPRGGLIPACWWNFKHAEENMLKTTLIGGAICVGLGASACGAAPDSSETQGEEQEAVTAAVFSGKLNVSTTSTTVGSPIVVTESATNLTSTQEGPIILGIRRLGFTVTAVQKPRTGICRIAGSATCNFVELAPSETQTYSLTLVANTPGTYTIQGWATSTSLTGGASESVTVVVH